VRAREALRDRSPRWPSRIAEQILRREVQRGTSDLLARLKAEAQRDDMAGASYHCPSVRRRAVQGLSGDLEGTAGWIVTIAATPQLRQFVDPKVSSNRSSTRSRASPHVDPARTPCVP
jgi:hypothetical protein